MVLELSRFVEKNTVSGKYHLGSRLMELGLSAVSRLDVYEVAGPHLRTLVKETGETAHLAVLRDGQVVSLVNIESSRDFAHAGYCRHPDTRPLHFAGEGHASVCATGKYR